MAGHAHQTIDVLPKLAIVGLLCAAMVGIHAWGAPWQDVNPGGLLAVGFVVLASYTIGELSGVVRLPHVTGYLLAGLAMGESAGRALSEWGPLAGWVPTPFAEGILNHEVLAQLSLLDTLALALICLTAGGELRLEALREGLGRYMAIIAGQSVLVVPGVALLFVLVSGPIDAIAVPQFLGMTVSQAASVGLVLGMVSIATAIAPTMAVINATRAKGPLTSTILTVAVLMDMVVVLGYSAAVTIALTLLPQYGGSGGLGVALVNIVASLALGTSAGVLLILYLRYVGTEVLLFITGMIFATAEAATAMSHWIDPAGHPELAMVFIAAGFTTANFSTLGDALLHELERMSAPVYVLFFSMAGAKLHLDALVEVLPLALTLVGLRIALIYVGARAGATAAGAAPLIQRYAWMGLVPQAGLALTLCGAVRVTFPGELGEGLFTLILAGIALNETLGPILVQYALGQAGETADRRGETGVESVPTDPEAGARRLAPWQRADAEPDPWGPAPASASEPLNTLAVDLELELRQLVRDLDRGPLTAMEASGEDFVRVLRRDFLRFHRQLHAALGEDYDKGAFLTALRAGEADLTRRWRNHVLDRQGSVRRVPWSPRALQEAVDQRVNGLPDAVTAPLEADSLLPREESTWISLHRRLLRIRLWFGALNRQVLVRDLARYHFHGRVAGRMEGLAALVVNAELHLAARTAATFDALDAGVDAVAALAREGASPQRLAEAVERLRQATEGDFTLASSELEWIARDTHQRATAVLGRAMSQFKTDLMGFGGPDLPRRQRRFALVFDDRTRGLRALTEGLDAAWRSAGTRYGALALALEVAELEGRVKEAVDEHTDRIARQIRGKALTQLHRTLDGLRALVARADALLQPSELSGGALAAALGEAVEPVARVVDEAIEATAALHGWLAADASDEALLDALLTAAQGLTERYEVPVGVPRTGEWALPSPVPTTEIPFREVTMSYIEAHIARDLVDITRRLSVRVDGLGHALQELARVLQFNAELARSELDVHLGAVPEGTRTLVHEMLRGAWGRSVNRLELAADEAAPWPEEARRQVREAVVTKLDAFREQVFDGRITALRHTLLREVQVRRRLLTEAGNWSAVMGGVGERVSEGVAIALGDERIGALRYRLGLPEAVQIAHPAAFAPPHGAGTIPVVYGRLFTDHALETGELLTGRELEYATALRALRADSPGVFRTVALVGQDPFGRQALANGLARGLGASTLERRSLRGPISALEVAAWFTREPGGLVLIDGIEHLYALRPGGFAPLERLVQGIVEDAGRTAFLVSFDLPVWSAAAHTAISSVFAEVVRLRALSADELRIALLARHGMSGYALRIEASSDLAWRLHQGLLRGDDPQERALRAWFHTLHAASAGSLTDALRLWTASVLDVDEAGEEVVLGPVPAPPVSRLRRLPDDTLLTLRRVLEQGTTTAVQHADAFRISTHEAEAHLANLLHAGLLTHADGQYAVAGHLQSSVVGVLTARGWFA